MFTDKTFNKDFKNRTSINMKPKHRGFVYSK